jgi:hypothetical protein
MDIHGRGELELLSIFAYLLDNLEWAITLVVQLP